MEEEAAMKKIEKGKLLFEQGLLNSFEDIFSVVPYSVIAKKSKINNARLKVKMSNPLLFKIDELVAIAEIMNIDAVALFQFILEKQREEKAK